MKRTVPAYMIFALGLALAAFASKTLLKSSPTTLHNVGDMSPVASIRTLDGRDIALTNQVVLLNFFATWCSPCMHEMPFLQKELWDALKDKGFIMVALGREHSPEEIRAFQAKSGYTFPFGADPQGEMFSKFAKDGIPLSVLIGKDGRIKFQSQGAYEESLRELRKTAEAELASPN